MNGLLEIVKSTGKSLPLIILENEMAITGQSEQHIREGAQRILNVMVLPVERLLGAQEILPERVGAHGHGLTGRLRAAQATKKRRPSSSQRPIKRQ